MTADWLLPALSTAFHAVLPHGITFASAVVVMKYGGPAFGFVARAVSTKYRTSQEVTTRNLQISVEATEELQKLWTADLAKMREEREAELAAIRKEVADLKGEVDEWKDKYYGLVEERAAEREQWRTERGALQRSLDDLQDKYDQVVSELDEVRRANDTILNAPGSH